MEHIERTVELFKDGMHPKQIAEELGMSITAVRRRLAARGIKQGIKQRFSPEDVIRYRQAWAEKRMTAAQISAESGVGRSSVDDMLKGLTYK